MNWIRSRQVATFNGAQPSLRAVARQLAIPPSTFTRIEQGKSPSAEALLKILVWVHGRGIDPWDQIMSSIAAPAKRRN